MTLQELLREYLDSDIKEEKIPFLNEGICASVPIVPQQKNKWEIISSPNRLSRSYDFESSEIMKIFLNESLDYQESVQHHGKFLIENQKVTIEIYTHDVEDVTEFDLEWAKMIDDIYEDVQFYVSRT